MELVSGQVGIVQRVRPHIIAVPHIAAYLRAKWHGLFHMIVERPKPRLRFRVASVCGRQKKPGHEKNPGYCSCMKHMYKLTEVTNFYN